MEANLEEVLSYDNFTQIFAYSGRFIFHITCSQVLVVIILLLCTKQPKLAPTSPPVVPLPPPLPPAMPPKYARGKPLPPRPSSEPAWLQEIHGNSLFLSKQRDSCGDQEGGREEGEDDEEGLLVIENDGGENLDEATFPPGVV